jgi:ketosteroid isomerase-like protein
MAQPVSPEILARFKEGFECWNRDEIEEMASMYAEDAVFDLSAVFADTAPVRGHEDMNRYWSELRETWAGIRQDPIEAFDLGSGQYAVDVRLSGKGSRSGIEVDQRFAMLYTFGEDGKVVSARLFPDVTAAFSAASSAAQPA